MEEETEEAALDSEAALEGVEREEVETEVVWEEEGMEHFLGTQVAANAEMAAVNEEMVVLAAEVETKEETEVVEMQVDSEASQVGAAETEDVLAEALLAAANAEMAAAKAANWESEATAGLAYTTVVNSEAAEATGVVGEGGC